MIRFKVQNGNKKEIEIKVLHKWDLPENADIRDWNNVDCKDQYVMFDDGSDLYSNVLSFNSNIIRTDCGAFKINDIVHCFIPKYPWSSYSGCMPSDEHPYVRPYGRQEKALATRMIGGEQLKVVTTRVKMLVLERLNEALSVDCNIDELYIAKNLVRLTKGDGMAAVSATKIIMNLSNINPDGKQEQLSVNGPMFHNMSNIEEAEIVSDNTIKNPFNKKQIENVDKSIKIPALNKLRQALSIS